VYQWAGLILLPTGRKSGEFRRCGTFDVSFLETKIFKSALDAFARDAPQSGLPYQNVKGVNQFIVTII
jgi:hypothetical protein